MIRRFDAPLTTHVNYRTKPIEWLGALVALATLASISIGAMGLIP